MISREVHRSLICKPVYGMETQLPESTLQPKTLENDRLEPYEQPNISIRQDEWKPTESPNFRHTVPSLEGIA